MKQARLEKLKAIAEEEAAFKKQAFEESITGLVPAYEELTDVTRRYFESEQDYTARVIEQKQEWIPLLDAAKRQLEEMGLIGTEAYRALIAALEDYNNLLAHQKEFTGTFGEGFGQGVKDAIVALGTDFQNARDMALNTAQAMEESFSSVFFDAFKGELKTFNDYFTAFTDSILKAWSDLLAKMITRMIASGLMEIFAGLFTGGTTSIPKSGGGAIQVHQGGLIMHKGGVVPEVPRYVPKFHFGGLASDEVPAILQKGEYVVSRKGVQALEKINKGQDIGGDVNVHINLENKSSAPNMKARTGSIRRDGKDYIISVFLEDFESRGPMFQAVRS